MDSAPQKSRRRRSIRNLRRSSANFILSGKSVLDDKDPLVDDAESTQTHLSTLASDYGSAWLDEEDLQKASDIPTATGWSDEKDYDAVDTEIDGLSADRRNVPQNEEFPASRQCNELSSDIFPAGLITSTSSEVTVAASTNFHHMITHDRQSCDSFEKSRYGSDSLETTETKLCHQLDENIALSSADSTGNNSEGLDVLDVSNIQFSTKEDQSRNVEFKNPSFTVNRDTPIESLSTSDTSSEHLNQGFVSQQQSSPLQKLSSDHTRSTRGDNNILSALSPSDVTRSHSNNAIHVYSTDSGHSLASDKTDKSPLDVHNMALCVSSSSASAQSDTSDTGLYSVSASSSDTGKEHITLKFTRLSEIWTPRSAVPVKSKSDTSASTGKFKRPGKTVRPLVSDRNMPRFVGGSQSHHDSTLHPTTSKMSTITTSSSTPLISGKKKYSSKPNPAKAKPKTVELLTPCPANSESQNQSLSSSSVQSSSSVTGANMSNIIQQLSQKLKTLQASMGLAGSEESNNAETPCPVVRSRSRESNNYKKLSQIHQPSDQQEDRITSNDGIDKVNNTPSENDIRPLCDSMLELSVSKSKVNSGDSESGMATLPDRNEMSEGMDGDVSLLQEHVIVTSDVMPSRWDAKKDDIVLQPNIQPEGEKNQVEPIKTCRQKKRLRLSLKKETTEMPEVITKDVGQKPEVTDTKDVEPKIPEVVEESVPVPAHGLEQSESAKKQPLVEVVTEGMKSDEFSANSNANAPTVGEEVNLYVTAMEDRKETDASNNDSTPSKDKSKQIVQEVRLLPNKQKKIQQKGKGHQHCETAASCVSGKSKADETASCVSGKSKADETASCVSGKSKADERVKLKCKSKPTGHIKKSFVSKEGENSVRKLGNEQIVDTVNDGTSGVSKVKGKKSVTKSSAKGLETSKAASEFDHSKKEKIHKKKQVKIADKCGQNATNNAKQEDGRKHSTEVEERENIPEFDHAEKEKIHKEKKVKNVDKCGQNSTSNAKQEDVLKHSEVEEMENVPQAHDSGRLSLSQQDTSTAEKKNGKQATEKPSKAKSQRRSSRFFSPPDEFRSNDHIEQQSEHEGNELVEKQSNTKSQRRSSRFFSPPEEFRSKDDTDTEQRSEYIGNELMEKQLNTKSRRRSSRLFSPSEEFKKSKDHIESKENELAEKQLNTKSQHPSSGLFCPQSLPSSESAISSLPEPAHDNKESSTDLNTCETVCEETENKENISDTLVRQTSHLNVEDYRAILMEDIQKFGNAKDGEMLEEVIDDFVSLCVNEDNRLENSINVKDGNESRKKRQRRRSSNIYKASADNDNHPGAENRDPAFAGDANAYCANVFFRSEANVTPENLNQSEKSFRPDQCLESDFIGSAEFSSACEAGLAKQDAPCEMIVNDEKYGENCLDKDLSALEVNDGQREDIDILSQDADCDLHEEILDVPQNVSIRARQNRKSWDLSQLTDMTETRRSTRRSSKGSKDDKQVVGSSKLHQPGEGSSQQEQEPALSNEDSGSPQAISPTLENLYRNKNYVLPKPKSWETIKENPSATQPIFTKQKFKRFLVFGEHHVSYAKLQRRHKKALDVHNRNLNRVGLHVLVSDEDFEQKMLDVQLFLEGSPNN